MQGYPVAEAAGLLGVPVGTVKSRCARGRARLLPLVRHLREDGTAPAAGTGPRDEGVPREAVPRETERPARSPRAAASPPGNPSGARTVTRTGPDTGRPILEGDASTR